MIVKLQVVELRIEKWPARGDRPAGEAYRIYGRDNTMPLRHALRDSVLFRISNEDVEKWWRKLVEIEETCPTLSVAVRKVDEMRGDQIMEGDIVTVEDGQSKKIEPTSARVR